MSLSLEDLWKAATDEKLIEAISRWESTNENGQRTLLAEVKRRGLKVAVPEITVRPTQSASAVPSPFAGKAVLLAVVIVAIVVALAVFVK